MEMLKEFYGARGLQLSSNKLFSLYASSRVLWFRFGREGFGMALHTHLSKPLFSERNGYNVPLIKVWKWRVFVLDRYGK